MPKKIPKKSTPLSLPATPNSPVLRTDFSNDSKWNEICAAFVKPSVPDGFIAYVSHIEVRAFDGLSLPQLLAFIPNDYEHQFVIVVDENAIKEKENAVLVVNLERNEEDGEESESKFGDAFRAMPREIQCVENNLSVGNMDFFDFKSALGADGVFRGFDTHAPGDLALQRRQQIFDCSIL